jgi:hypothetical protein
MRLSKVAAVAMFLAAPSAVAAGGCGDGNCSVGGGAHDVSAGHSEASTGGFNTTRQGVTIGDTRAGHRTTTEDATGNTTIFGAGRRAVDGRTGHFNDETTGESCSGQCPLP